jgi:hypothetical protein
MVKARHAEFSLDAGGINPSPVNATLRTSPTDAMLKINPLPFAWEVLKT